jgi:hypothetical protein
MLQEVTMVTNNGITLLAIPSAPDAAKDAFTVEYGGQAPPPPSV